jgi:thiamine-monophosphate kinase
VTRLDNIGERRLIEGLFTERYGKSGHTFGDDCAYLFDAEGDGIVASTDPAPRPVAWDLGFRDYFHWGWLLAACNLSDLAAVGAQPVSLLSSLTLPNSMEIGELTRFLDGFDQCSRTYGCPVVGGNIKEGSDFRCEATIIGRTKAGRPLSRKGALPGDVLLAAGNSGYFWSAVIALRKERSLNEDLVSALVRPQPQIKVGGMMRKRGFAHASTDASDGLYYAMHCLTVSQGLGFRVEPDRIEYSDLVLQAAEMAGVDPLRLILGFGDMQIVCAVPRDHLEEARSNIAANNQQSIILGSVTQSGQIEVVVNGNILPLANFDNERLTSDSQFTAGFAAYEHRLLSQPLIKETTALRV